MFEKFLSDNVENFRQRYEGTYGFYRDEKKKRLLVRLDSISNTECVFVNSDGIDFRLRPDTPRDIGFEFLPPKSAWYNTKDGAMYTQRLAQRQFQRGVTSKSLEIYLLRVGVLVPTRVDFKNLSAIYENQISVEEAVRGMKENSLAISPQFSIDLASNSVFLLKEQVGTVGQGKDGKLSFKLYEPQLWRTEITDAIKSLGLTAEIA